MSKVMETAPILSTPDTHIFEDSHTLTVTQAARISDEEFSTKYEIQRTVSELEAGKWTRIALQFPDSLLPDAPRVVDMLRRELKRSALKSTSEDSPLAESNLSPSSQTTSESNSKQAVHHLYILGDTSYGACCVDEIAAEHADAQVVIHYGRSCLSPTARLPVIYVFTQQPLDHNTVVDAFKITFPEKESQIILMADVTYSNHIQPIVSKLKADGYASVFAPELRHNPSSLLPNRTVPEGVTSAESLQNWKLFYISSPPPALLLTLSSRVSNIYIYPTTSTDPANPTMPTVLTASTSPSLRRRYGLLTSLSTCSIFGILVNTLSVAHYLPAIQRIKAQIAAAGKKSYLFAVGKVNAAKIANFAEVGGWVVVGCWESSLLEEEGESGKFWKPVITPFELDLLLKGDQNRVWTGEWRGDFQLEGQDGDFKTESDVAARKEQDGDDDDDDKEEEEEEEESTPPEFDLRTGRYISHTRPMAKSRPSQSKTTPNGSSISSRSLTKRAPGDLAVIGNQVSPGAEFLRSHRTWRGLGSDIEIAYDESGNETGTAIEEGRTGIARGYANEQDIMLVRQLMSDRS
jgi:diphthamide biosynthesis protein 2